MTEQMMGLRVVDGTVYVLGRDQITRLHDLNGDGEADFYESFSNLGVTMASYHAFHYDLQTDREGNFYYLVGGNHVEPEVALHNCLLKVAKDGASMESIATGFRATNGMAIGPNDEITCADNEGNWMPTSRLNWVKKGGFYGDMHTAHKDPLPKEYDQPLCWIHRSIDNSSGGEVWVTGDAWGPFKGHMLHLSYGTCSLFHVLYEKVGDQMQGGVVRFPMTFASGILRGRFNAKDGQLYVAGIKGWSTSGARDGCLQRVRYTGKPVQGVVEMHVRKDAIELTFAHPLDPESAADLDRWAAQQWNYLYSEKYGSPDFSVENPRKQGRDTVEIMSAKTSSDGRKVTLEIPGLKPVMQMLIRFKIKAADGTPINQEIWHTIHKVPEK